MTTLTTIIDQLGVNKVADLCGISPRVVYKLRKSNALPGTEYTKETSYSAKLSLALDNQFSTEEILQLGLPRKSFN